MATYYAAVDMGASSGRLILGHMENGKMELEDVPTDGYWYDSTNMDSEEIAPNLYD